MGFLTIKKSNFLGILLVVLISTFTYSAVSYIITHNAIQYTTFPKSINVWVYDRLQGHEVLRVLPVHSKLPIDTVKPFLDQVKQGNVSTAAPVVGDILYNENSTFIVWTMLTCIMITVAAGSVPVFINQLIDLKKKFELKPRQVFFSVAYALVLAAFLAFTNRKLPGYYNPNMVIRDLHILFKNANLLDNIVLLTIVLILPAITLIFMIGISSNNILSDTHDVKKAADAVKKINLLNGLLNGVLQIVAVIIVFTVFTTSALGVSIKSTVEVEGLDLFPKEVSYVYGLYFSLFLCIVYVPAYYNIKQNYNRLKENTANLDLTDAETTTWYKELLGNSKIEGSALDNVKLALTVLAPLLTSFLPEGMHLMK
jgi:hypothetical protein